MNKFDTMMILGKEIDFYGTKEEPMFLAKDVAEWIDYQFVSGKNTRNVSKMLLTIDECEKVKSIRNMDTTSNLELSDTNNMDTTSKARKTQEMWFITEDGLYECLMQSRKPIAKELKKKIKLHLKQLRQTGATIEIGREEEMVYKYFPSFSDDVKQAMVSDIMKSNKKLQDELHKANETIDTLITNNTTFDEFNRVCNACARAIASAQGVQVSHVWSEYYHFLYNAKGYNLGARQKNEQERLNKERIAKSGKSFSQSTLNSKVSKLSTLKSNEYSECLEIMKSYALDYGVDIVKIVKLNLQEI